MSQFVPAKWTLIITSLDVLRMPIRMIFFGIAAGVAKRLGMNKAPYETDFVHNRKH